MQPRRGRAHDPSAPPAARADPPLHRKRPPPPSPAPPQLLNRGLLSFRSGVLLAYGVRRPTQSALAWLAARARDGDSDLPPADASLLDRARKMLTELDVYDDGTQPAPAHTHGKFAAAFGALLLRDRRSERLGLRER